jgi:hypothetical protein
VRPAPLRQRGRRVMLSEAARRPESLWAIAAGLDERSIPQPRSDRRCRWPGSSMHSTLSRGINRLQSSAANVLMLLRIVRDPPSRTRGWMLAKGVESSRGDTGRLSYKYVQIASLGMRQHDGVGCCHQVPCRVFPPAKKGRRPERDIVQNGKRPPMERPGRESGSHRFVRPNERPEN